MSIEFCCSCGRWVAAAEGILREAPDGSVEVVCPECMALESNRACSITGESTTAEE